MLQEMSKEIEVKQMNLEKLSTRCEEIAQKSADPQLSSSVVTLATRYQILQATAKVSISLNIFQFVIVHRLVLLLGSDQSMLAHSPY